jgi:hypothetical protein
MMSCIFAVIGLVIWFEGGLHARTWASWLMLVGILVGAALPVPICRLFC